MVQPSGQSTTGAGTDATATGDTTTTGRTLDIDPAVAMGMLRFTGWPARQIPFRASPAFQLLIGLPQPQSQGPQQHHAPSVAAGADPQRTRQALALFLVGRMRMLSDWAVGTPNTEEWIDSYTPPPEPAGGVPLNLCQLGRAMADGALATSYREVRRDIFEAVVGQTVAGGGGVGGGARPSTATPAPALPSVSLAQWVLTGAAMTAEPAVFSSVLAALVAAGVDFGKTKALRSATSNDAAVAGAMDGNEEEVVVAPGLLSPPRATLDAACWQLHHTAVEVSAQLRAKAADMEVSGVGPAQLGMTRSFLRGLVNAHSLLSLLSFYAVERPAAAVPAVAVAAGGAPMDEAAAGVTPSPLYTASDFNTLCHSEAVARAEDERLAAAAALTDGNKKQYSQLQDVCSRSLESAVAVFSDYGCRWRLVDSPENTDEVRNMLAAHPSAVADSLRVIAALCDDFPPLKTAVLRRATVADTTGTTTTGSSSATGYLLASAAATGTFRVEQLLDCGALRFPPTAEAAAALSRPYDAAPLLTAEGRRAAGLRLVRTPLQPNGIGGDAAAPLPGAVRQAVYEAEEVEEEGSQPYGTAYDNDDNTATAGKAKAKKRQLCGSDNGNERRLMKCYGRLKARFAAAAAAAAAANGAADTAAAATPSDSLAAKRAMKEAHRAATGAVTANIDTSRYGDVFDDAPTPATATSTRSVGGGGGAGPAANAAATFVGLQNLGNTCFLNSVTQLLFRATGFTRELIESTMHGLTSGRTTIDPATVQALTASLSGGGGTSGSGSSNKSPVVANPAATRVAIKVSLMLLLLEMYWRVARGHGAASIWPDYFTVGLPPPFNDHHQHDVSEFSKFLLEQLDTDERRETAAAAGASGGDEEAAATAATVGGAERPTIVSRWFGGSVVSDMRCLECRSIRSHVNPYWDCSLPIRSTAPTADEETVTAAAVATAPGGASPSSLIPVANETHRDGGGAIAAETTYHRARSSSSLAVNDSNSSGNSRSGSIGANPDGEEGEEAVAAGGGGGGARRSASDPPLLLLMPPEAAAGRDVWPAPTTATATTTIDRGVSIQRLLTNVTDPARNAETLDGPNCLACDRCGRRTATELTTRIIGGAGGGNNNEEDEEDEEGEGETDGIPHFLTLQLNRFQYNRQRYDYEKILDAVWLDEIIALPVLLSGTEGEEEGMAHDEATGNDDDSVGRRVTAAEAAERAAEARETQRLARHSSKTEVLFRLKAFVVHSGSTPASGHYFTIAKAHSSACVGEADRAAERLEVESFLYDQRASSAAGGGVEAAAAAEGGAHEAPLRVTSRFYENWVMLNDSNVRRLKPAVMEGILAGRNGVFSHLETPYLVLYERVNDPNPFAAPRRGTPDGSAGGGGGGPGRLPGLDVTVSQSVEESFLQRILTARAGSTASWSRDNNDGGDGGDGGGYDTDYGPGRGSGFSGGGAATSYIPP